MKIQIIAPLLAIDGYGYSAQNLAIALSELGVDVKFHAHDWREDKFSDKRLLDMVVEKKDLDREVPTIVYHLPPTLENYKDFKNLYIFSMWETDKFPSRWVSFINKYAKAVFTPSLFCREVFKKSGIKKPINVIQLGINLDRYKYFKRKRREKFKFLITGKLDNRKNHKLLIEAFREEFSDRLREAGRAELIIKTRAGTDLGINLPPEELTGITIISKDFTEEEMYQLYLEADCFVFPSKGEGFGLPPREAMATGLPVILTKYSGIRDIADENYSYPLTELEIEKADYPKKVLLGIADEDLGNWRSPLKEELKRRMREVFDDYDKALFKGRLAHSVMLRLADPKIGAQALYNIIRGYDD